MNQPEAAAPEPKPVRRKRKWRRRIVKLLIFSVILLALAPLALRLSPVRNWVANKVGQKIGRKVEIEKASAFWFSGIDLEGVTIHSPVGFAKPLATIKQVHCDLDLMRMLRGKVGASIRVTEPHITLLKDAQGRTNTDGLVPEDPADSNAPALKSNDDAKTADSSDMRLRFQLINGRIDASEGDNPTRTIREIHVLYVQTPNEPATIDVTGQLEGMSTGNGDVEIRALSALKDGGGSFTVVLSEALDLSKLAVIVENATDVRGLRGTLKLDVKGDMSADGGMDGAGSIIGQGIALQTPGGLHATIGDLNIALNFKRSELGTTTLADGTITQIAFEQHDPNGGPPVRVVEPTVTLKAEGLRSPDGSQWSFTTATLRAGTTASVELQKPIRISLGDAWQAEGQAGIRVDLGRLSVLGDVVPSIRQLRGGLLSASVQGRTTPEGAAQIGAGLRVERLAFHPGDTFERGYTEPTIDSQIRVQRGKDKRTQVEILSMTLSGVRCDGVVHLSDQGMQASLNSHVDLARARVVAALLSLEQGASLSGTIEAKTTITEANDQMRAKGNVTATQFTYVRPGAIPWREPHMTIDHDVSLPSAAGRGTMHVMKANLGSLVADATGSTWISEPESDVDAKLTLSGQAERLVDLLAMARGEGFQDLRAQGAVGGTITVNGPADKAHVLINGDLTFGSWSSAGLNVTDAKLTLRRSDPTQPLNVGVTAGLNGGTFAAQSALDLRGATETPWTLALDVKGADTSKVLVSKGAGRYFAYLLPSLLPANADVPVMSGKLDVDVDLNARDLSGDALSHSLRGTSVIRMVQGEIRNSTLFGGSGGSPQMQQLISILSKVDPEIRRTIGTVGKAMNFSSIDSSARIGNREVQVDRLDLIGPYLRVSSTGRATFDQRLAMNTNVVLLGKGGERVKKLLPDSTIPLQMTGMMSDPQVTPRIDPKTLMRSGLVNEGKKLLDGITGGKGATDGKKKNPVDRLKDLFK